MEKALDISKWQDTFDASTAKAQGITTVIARCAYESGKDVRWDKFVQAIKSAGFRFGCYGYTTAHYKKIGGSSITLAQALEKGRRHADAWIALAKAAGVDSWVAVDQEMEKNYTMGLSKADNTTLLIDMCDRIAAAGLPVCVYCSASWAQSYIDLARMKYPLWIAYYYADPNDPDFSGCKPIEQVNSGYARYMLALGDQLIAWQFGRIGYGPQYGAGSPNIDKDWLYRQPEKEDKPLEFINVKNKAVQVTSDDNVKGTCEVFSSMDVNAVVGKLERGSTTMITTMATEDSYIVGSTKGRWVTLENGNFVAAISPLSQIVEVEEPEVPTVDLSAVMAALSRIEYTQAEHTKQLTGLTDSVTKIADKQTAAGAALSK